MLKFYIIGLALCICSVLKAQESQTLYQSKKIRATTSETYLDSVPLNNTFFKIKDKQNNEIDTTHYVVNFSKALLQFKPKSVFLNDTVAVRYLKYPQFLTKEYHIYDRKRVMENSNGAALYQIAKAPSNTFVPFDGLATSGSISRGVSIGNNQNAVVNSSLDLQITGKISEKVNLRASIQDNNIPLQEGGYSQKLDQFDQIFIELFSDKWAVRAGDLFLENRTSQFINFNKKVQGLSSKFEFGKQDHTTNVFASAALVRGQYTKSTFQGQEGNQGPYKLKGPNGELYVLVVSGSERVYVNGILLKRGENADYMMDYNAGELRFTTLFPITSEMRIAVEYQFADRNYNRVITYGGSMHQEKTWNLGGFLYSENDMKNQPLQQSLSSNQVEILSEAGDNPNNMNAPSAFTDAFSENKILYKKTILNGISYYEYSNNPSDELFNVRFSFIGSNQGNYVLKSATAIGKIYEYVAPINGVLKGNYEPIIRLIAPTALQIATVLGKFNPSEKSNFDFELGISNFDANLYSKIDDQNNQGLALKSIGKQRLFSNNGKFDAFFNFQLIQQQFKPIERIFTIEFNRDWNLTNPSGNQMLFLGGLQYQLNEKVAASYQFEKLDFSDGFTGNRQLIKSNVSLQKWNFQNNSSFLSSKSNTSTSKFLRNQTVAKYHFKKNWIGSSFRIEDNREQLLSTGLYSLLSQKFSEYGAFAGRGDSTKVYMSLGYLNRVNDSVQNGLLKRVNRSQSYFLKSKLIQNEKIDLSFFCNYRILQFSDPTKKDAPSVNSRILYNDKFFNQLIQSSTAFETTSGTLAQQEFTYVAVKQGQGVYSWNDYNANGIQELEEFETAKFVDQANYVRVFLPNQIFIKTHQNKLSQSITLNPSIWQNEKGFKKTMSYFYNQLAVLTERKVLKDNGNFDFNPFYSEMNEVIGLNFNLRNSLFYNRGKQHHSVTYTFLGNNSKNLLVSGTQESNALAHQIQYLHLLQKSWLCTINLKTSNSELLSQNYGSKNFNITSHQLAPKMSYLFSKNASLDVFIEYQQKKNIWGENEVLLQSKLGTSFSIANQQQLSMNGEISVYDNNFNGNSTSPVAFQMLEGLQPGKNATWRILIQKNITKFLDINFSYQGRKSETSQTIHTGNVQLRAFF